MESLAKPSQARLARESVAWKSLVSPGQGQGFEVSLAIEAWLFRPENQKLGKPRIRGHVLQVTAIRTRDNFFLQYFYLFIIMTIRNVFFYRINTKSSLGK